MDRLLPYLNHKPNGYWKSFENCQAEAIKYHNKKEFKKAYPSAYEYCRIYKFLDKLKFKDDDESKE